jgi:large subunit ribosomal protein LP2
LDSVGIATDTDRADKLVSELSGKSVWEVIDAGKAKLSSVPSVGPSAAPSAGGAPAAGGSAPAKPKEEEKKEEEEVDEDMGGLFGGDDDEGY